MTMDYLLLATGFTGALTLGFLFRSIARKMRDVPTVSLFASPKGGAADAIVHQLGKARKEVLILARSFASTALAKAVLDAKLRGAKVEIVLDRHNEKDPMSDLHLFAEQGLAPYLDTQFPCCHDNLMLIDDRVLVTGSFDFTRQAEEENSDTLLIVTGYPDAMTTARKHFDACRKNAKEFRPAKTDKPVPNAPRMSDMLARAAA